jgi:hypothetical protein
MLYRPRVEIENSIFFGKIHSNYDKTIDLKIYNITPSIAKFKIKKYSKNTKIIIKTNNTYFTNTTIYNLTNVKTINIFSIVFKFLIFIKARTIYYVNN